MAKIRIKGDTSGYVDLSAPNTASSSTLDLDQLPQKNVANTFTETQQITNTTNGAYYKINAPTSGDIASGYLVYQGSTIRGGFYTNPSHGMTHISDNYHTFRNNNANRMTIDENGYVTTDYQPSFAASRTGGHVTTDGDIYKPNVIRHNVGGHYDSSTGRFTAPTSGNYLIAIMLMSLDDQAYNNKHYKIRKNGATLQNAYSTTSSGVGHHQWQWSGVISLNAQDYIDIQKSNVSLYGTNGYYSWFSGHLLG